MFNLFQEDSIMAEFDKIAAEPIDNEPYSLVQNPKPVVESVLDFNGTKVDTGKWCEGSGVCEDKKKVGKAKTAPNPKLTKESAKTKSGEKKDDGKIVENVHAAEKKDDGKVTEVKTTTKVEESKTAPKATEAKGFDAAAKSAKTSQEGEAKSNKKFAKGCDIQTRIKLFKEGVKALGIDDKTKKDADKVLKEFDKISKMFVKAKMESAEEPKMEGLIDKVKGYFKGNTGTEYKDPAADEADKPHYNGNNVVIKYGDRQIGLSREGDSDVYKLTDAYGSKSLQGALNTEVKFIQDYPVKVGNELRFNIGGRNWHSGQPISAIEGEENIRYAI